MMVAMQVVEHVISSFDGGETVRLSDVFNPNSDKASSGAAYTQVELAARAARLRPTQSCCSATTMPEKLIEMMSGDVIGEARVLF